MNEEELDALETRAMIVDPLLEVDYDTQLDVERDPYGAREAIETALYLIRDQTAAITTLRAQLAEAHTRIEAMESGDWSKLKLVRFENGQMDVTAGPIPAIAEYLAQMMQDGEGKYFNFMEVSINHNTAGPMTLSLQRKNGKTPNQLREEAEARADRAEQRVATLEAALAAPEVMHEDAPAAIVGEIGNQIHNLGCELQNDEDVSLRLSDLACRCWDAAKLFPTDRTALDRMLAEAREKALREAAHVLTDEIDLARIAMPQVIPILSADRKAILALIEAPNAR